MPDPVGVIFDFYGTLARPIPRRARLSDILSRHGLADDPGVWSRWSTDALNGADLRLHCGSRDQYDQLLRDRRRNYLLEIGAGDDLLEGILDAIDDHLRGVEMEAYADATALVDRLHHDGVPMVVCSNWDWDLEPYVDQAGFEGRFKAFVNSSQCGFRKPHPRIYQAAVDALGASPEELTYVGDSWVPDVEGPRSAGLATVYLRRPDRPPSARRSEPAAIPPDVRCIESLLEL